MNRSENPEAVSILELMVKNPYNTNIPVNEFYRVINRFYGFDRTEFNKAIFELEEQGIVMFSLNEEGDIETVVTVTDKGNDLAAFLFPRSLYGL